MDLAVLKGLEDQLGRVQMARDFAEDYSELWGQRERRLVDSLQSGDRTAALDAVISLKVSSAMVGGLRLARLAAVLEDAVREGDLHYEALAMVSIHGPATIAELEHRYLRKGGSSGSVASCGNHVERPEITGSASR
ncbi:Hpt domain-containing protein [Pseudarthrobacter sulfonivorans]|uniref:Hpt domain-containing protein n=1 Tax=Pseudarthrobacter sulfonivorans TaxID=121292 RepID=UPI00168A5875|nr:Hpt domain-containing protein [Pseudarthrobacter sulfonivorans]